MFSLLDEFCERAFVTQKVFQPQAIYTTDYGQGSSAALSEIKKARKNFRAFDLNLPLKLTGL